MKLLHLYILLLSLSSLSCLDLDLSSFTEFGETTGTDFGCNFYHIKDDYLLSGTTKGFSIYQSEEDGSLTLIDTLNTEKFNALTCNENYLAISKSLMPNIDIYNISDMENIYYSHTIQTNFNLQGIKLLSNNHLLVNKLNDHSMLLDITNGNEIISYPQYLFRTESIIEDEEMLAYDLSSMTLEWVSLNDQNQIVLLKSENRTIDYASSSSDLIFLAVDNYIKMYNDIYEEVALDSISVNWYDISFAYRGIEIFDSNLLFIDADFNPISQMDEPVLNVYELTDDNLLYMAQEFFLENWDNRGYFLTQKVISCNDKIYVNAEVEGIKGYQIYDNQVVLISQYGEIAYWENSFLCKDNKIYLNARNKNRECIIYEFSTPENLIQIEHDLPYGQYNTFPYQSDYIYKKSYLNNEIEFYHFNIDDSETLIGSIPVEYNYLYFNFIPLMINSDYIVYQFLNDIYIGHFDNGIFFENHTFNLGSSNTQREFTAFMRNGYLYSLATHTNQIQIFDIDENNHELIATDTSHYFNINQALPIIQLNEKYICFRGRGNYNYLIELSPDEINIIDIYRLDIDDIAFNNIGEYFFMVYSSSSTLEIKEFDHFDEPHFHLIDTINFSSNIQSIDLIHQNENIYNMIVTTMGSIFYFQCAITPNGNLDITPVILNSSNYPNPFNPETTISYNIPKKGNVTVDIYNIKGQKVKSLLKEEQDAGKHSIIWKGNNDKGQKVSSGTYLYRVKSGDEEIVNKMMLVK